MEGAMIAERGKIELQRFRFDQPSVRQIIDDDMGEVGLAGDRAEAGELRHRKPGDIVRIRMRIGDAIEPRFVRRCWKRDFAAEKRRVGGEQIFRGLSHSWCLYEGYR